MKYPNCNKEGLKYLNQKKPVKKGSRDRMPPRKDFSAKCKKCGWEGLR